MGSNKGWLQLSPCLFFFSLSFIFCVKLLNVYRSRAGPYKGNSQWHYCKETKKKRLCFPAVLCQFGELWCLCFSWLIGFTISKTKSVQIFSFEVLYWFRAMVGLSHLKTRSWGPLNRFFFFLHGFLTQISPSLAAAILHPLVIHPRTISYREGHICLSILAWVV